MSGAPRRILVTGGTGLVGQAIIEALDHGAEAISLTRHGSDGWSAGRSGGGSAAGLVPSLHGHVVARVPAAERARHVRGDVTQPRLGLGDGEYERLAQEVDVVVHSAGVSDFTTPRRTTYALNLDGARNVAAFAEDADAPLYHVSSGYVNANGTSLGGRWGAEVYIGSKRAAEEAVRDCRMLAAVVRPSIVWSHSRTGWTPSFQGLHRLVGMMFENKLPLLPFGPQTRVDFLPHDTIGATIAELVRTEFDGEHWLTAGERAMPFGRCVDLVLELGERLGLELDCPRFIDPEMIDRLIRPAGGETVSRRVDLMLALTTHFSSQDVLPSSLSGDEVPDLELAFVRGAEHWAERNGYVTATVVASDGIEIENGGAARAAATPTEGAPR
jgi:nucleoside-diphosphate-sugar epimerase